MEKPAMLSPGGEVVIPTAAEGLRRVLKAVAEVVAQAGGAGYPVDGLRRTLAFLGVPPQLGDAIERRLVVDLDVKVSGGRLYFPSDPERIRAIWQRLASTQAEPGPRT